MSLTDKVKFFQAFILAKLRYGLATVWLITAQRRRIDGFVARCLRIIFHIPASFISRFSNVSVLQRAGLKPFSQQLLKHQLYLLRKVATQEPGHPMRKDTFVDASLLPQIGCYVRRIGRPRQEWTTQLLREGQQRLGGARFQCLLTDRSSGADGRWKSELEKVFN